MKNNDKILVIEENKPTEKRATEILKKLCEFLKKPSQKND